MIGLYLQWVRLSVYTDRKSKTKLITNSANRICMCRRSSKSLTNAKYNVRNIIAEKVLHIVFETNEDLFDSFDFKNVSLR